MARALTKSDILTSTGSRINFRAEQTFDSEQKRHYLNGAVTVFHCHHYVSLLSQLAGDAVNFEGPRLLAETAAEVFGGALRAYYRAQAVKNIPDRISIAEQYFAFVGLGKIEFEFWDGGGMATLRHSHVDEGWRKKWGQSEHRVNFIGEGYIQGAWAAIFDRKNPTDCLITETQSIVSGASSSRFEMSW